MYTDYQTLTANVMQLHSFCSAFGIQRKEKKRKVYIHIYPHYRSSICVRAKSPICATHTWETDVIFFVLVECALHAL